MATNKDPIFLNSIVTSNVTFVNADGTTAATAMTAGADGGAILKLSAVSDDTSDRICVLKINDGSTTIRIGEVTVPAGAGTDGTTPAVNLLDANAMPGMFQADGSIVLGPAAVFSINVKVAVTAAKSVDVTLQGGSYSV